MDLNQVSTIGIMVLGVAFGGYLAHHGVTLGLLYREVKRFFKG